MMNGLDLGLTGKRALVCASSEGLGKACALALARNGAAVTINGRDEKRLAAAAKEIAATGAKVTQAPGDMSTDEGRKAVLAICPAPDILVNNSGGPLPGNFRKWKEADWVGALEGNMLGAVFMIGAVVDGMTARRWGRIVNITSNCVKLNLQHAVLSTTARLGLTGFAAGVAREVMQYGVTINSLLPGPFGTKRLLEYSPTKGRNHGMTPEELLAERAAGNPMRTIGKPDDFGAWCAFLASRHSGYITGQSIVLDGGTYPA